MSRSGYVDDYDEYFPNALAFYRTRVENAIYGKRGQVFIRDLIAALDAMPEKKLIAEDLIRDGEVCAIGAVGIARGIDMSGLHPEYADEVAKRFGIAECMAREIVFENDEAGTLATTKEESPEARWQRMRDWAEKHLKEKEL